MKRLSNWIMPLLGLSVMVAVTLLFDAATASGVLLAEVALATPKDLKKLLGEIKAKQDEYKGKRMPEDVATALDAKVEEALEMQKAIDDQRKRDRKIEGLESKLRDVSDPDLPNDDQPDDDDVETKAVGRNKANEIVGYMHLGDFVVAQEGMKNFRSSGKPRAPFQLARLPEGTSMFGKRRGGGNSILVGLTRDQIRQVKAVPTLSADVIEPTRLPEIVRVTEQDRLTLRDVLDIQRTTSDAVKFTRIVSYTRAAGSVAHSALKPEAAISMDAVTEAVRTIAVHMPVEEQQLDDYPQLSGIINGELLYDVDKHFEELVMYGDGQGENFNGILNDPAVLSARTRHLDTLIDIARRGITDVRRAGYDPTAILADPLDWEDIVLEKGSDNRYVWVVVTDGATQRLWAVPVIETVAMEDFQGDAVEQRHLLVGDFQRGATLWDRMDASVSVGWVNDQFIRNQRTILAESRAAFGVKRPGAFRKYQTQEASSS